MARAYENASIAVHARSRQRWLSSVSLGVKTAVCVVAIVCVRALLADHVDDAITEQMKEREIPGLALAVVQSGKIIREQAYGFADEAHSQPVVSTTLFQGASVSKPVAALGA